MSGVAGATGAVGLLVVKIIRLSPAVMPVLCGVLC